MNQCPWCGGSLPSDTSDMTIRCPHCGKTIKNSRQASLQPDPSEPPGPDNPGDAFPDAESLLDSLSKGLPLSPADSDDAFARRAERKQEPEGEAEPPPEPDGEEPRKQVKQVKHSPKKKRRKKHMFIQKKTSSRAVLILSGIVLGALVVVFACIGLFMSLGSSTATPEKAAETFVKAITSQNLQFLTENTQKRGGGAVSNSDMKILCDTFPKEDGEKLKKHLLSLGDTSDPGYSSAYSCLSLEEQSSEDKKTGYILRLLTYPVFIETQAEGITYYVDDIAADSSATGGGVLLQVLPGRHTVKAVFEAYDKSYEAGTASVSSFSTEQVKIDSLGKNAGKLDILLAGLETDLQVMVDGIHLNIDDNGGIITLDPAFDGMKVSIVCDQYAEDYTVNADAEQVFTPSWVSDMEKQNMDLDNLAPDALTNNQLIQHVASVYDAFYASYLEATNQWDPNLIINIDPSYRENLVYRMETYNKDILFDLLTINVDRRSFRRRNSGDVAYVDFYVENVYNYAFKKEPDKVFAGGNLQTVTAVYDAESGKWLIHTAKIDDELQLSKDLITYKHV